MTMVATRCLIDEARQFGDASCRCVAPACPNWTPSLYQSNMESALVSSRMTKYETHAACVWNASAYALHYPKVA
jgi:hypothetical protein